MTPLVPTRAAPPSTVGSPSPPPAPGDGPSAGCRGAPAPRWFLNGKNGSTRCRRRRGRDQNRGSPGRGTRSRRAPRPSRGRLGPPGGSTGSVTPLLGTGVQGGPVLCLLRPQQPAGTRAQRGPPRASGAARTHGGQRTPALPERHLSARCAPPRNSPLHPTQRGPPRAAPCAGGVSVPPHPAVLHPILSIGSTCRISEPVAQGTRPAGQGGTARGRSLGHVCFPVARASRSRLSLSAA